MSAVRVKVKFFTVLRELIGKREEEFMFEKNITVGEVLSFLAERYGKEVREYLFEGDGEVKEFLTFLVNGKSVVGLNGLETRLKNGDILAIIPPVGGG